MKFKGISLAPALTPVLAAILAAALAAAAAAGADGFRGAILDAHNRERARLGEAPLVWSDALARGAEGWARHLARLGKLEHAATGDGENLWMGTAGAYTTAEMVDAWIAEKQDFVPGKFPDVARAGRAWHSVAHFTQVVWRDTRAIGCAEAAAGAWEVLVCRYDPPGNWVGEAPY